MLYIDTDKSDDVSNKYIRKVNVAVTEEQKQELIPLIENVNTVYPIVDQWNDDVVIFRLPNNIKEYEFDFSSGMGLLRFSD